MVQWWNPWPGNHGNTSLCESSHCMQIMPKVTFVSGSPLLTSSINWPKLDCLFYFLNHPFFIITWNIFLFKFIHLTLNSQLAILSYLQSHPRILNLLGGVMDALLIHWLMDKPSSTCYFDVSPHIFDCRLDFCIILIHLFFLNV